MSELILQQLAPLVDVFRPVIIQLSFLIGGVFGLYMILIVVRIYYEHKKLKILQDIRYNLDQANIHHNIPHSRHKPTWFKRMTKRLR